MVIDLWAGEYELMPRMVLGQRQVEARGLSFNFVAEQLFAPTDWSIRDDTRHLLFVHRWGHLGSMESDVDWGPLSATPPSVGDIWLVPSGDRCTSLVQGGIAGNCEIAVPDRVLDGATLRPRVKLHNPSVLHLVNTIEGVADRDDTVARLLKDSAAETLRLLIIDAYTVAPADDDKGRDTLDPPVCVRIIEYLEDGLESEITLESLAQLAEMSVAKFIAAFRATFHATPYQFLLDRRIDRAKTMLVNTSRTITEISMSVGFSTPNHFATTFRRRVGVTPRMYRQSQR